MGRNTRSSEWRELRKADEKASEKGKGHMEGDPSHQGSEKPPGEQRHEIPEGEFGPRQVQTGTLVENQDVQKIVNDFVGKVGDHQTLYHFEKRRDLF